MQSSAAIGTPSLINSIQPAGNREGVEGWHSRCTRNDRRYFLRSFGCDLPNAFDQCFLATKNPCSRYSYIAWVSIRRLDSTAASASSERQRSAPFFAPVIRHSPKYREQRKLPVLINHEREIARAFTLNRLVGFMVGEDVVAPPYLSDRPRDGKGARRKCEIAVRKLHIGIMSVNTLLVSVSKQALSPEPAIRLSTPYAQDLQTSRALVACWVDWAASFGISDQPPI